MGQPEKSPTSARRENFQPRNIWKQQGLSDQYVDDVAFVGARCVRGIAEKRYGYFIRCP